MIVICCWCESYLRQIPDVEISRPNPCRDSHELAYYNLRESILERKPQISGGMCEKCKNAELERIFINDQGILAEHMNNLRY